MSSSSTIRLFASPPSPAPSGSASYVVSVLLHIVVCGWVLLGIRSAPRIAPSPSIRHFTVRILNAQTPVPQLVAPAANSTAHTAASAMAASSGGSPSSMPSLPAKLAPIRQPPQVLIQPEAPPNVVLQHPVPLPPLVLLTPTDVPARTIVPPPQKQAAANVKPSLDAPNRETAPADIKIAAMPFAKALPTLPASTTSPVAVRSPDPAPHIPQTSAKPSEQPAPAQIVSLSNMQVKEGPVAVPLANSPQRPTASASLGTATSANSSQAGRGNPASRQSGSGAGVSSNAAKEPGGATQAPVSGPANSNAAATPPTPAQAPATESAPGSDLGAGPPATRVHLPKDGQFGFVVVGSSIADQYPETVGLWGGRVVYTVYLHLGPGKAWILQYSLPPGAEAASGAARPEAPWPFDIVQPHLDASDFTSDALMVHGVVNASGRFEHLAVVFPSDFDKAHFLLSALEQWQFRPGRENGRLAPMEVLLIIPEISE